MDITGREKLWYNQDVRFPAYIKQKVSKEIPVRTGKSNSKLLDMKKKF